MITPTRKRRPAPPTQQRGNIDNWKDGYISSKTADRIGQNGLRSSVNQVLKQDGTAAPRPSSVPYGEQPVGTILGEVVEFTKYADGVSENYEISLQNVSGTVKAYYRKDGGTWTVAAGKTFDTSASAHFCPIRDVDSDYNDEDKVVILNGEDNFSYLDINTFTVVPFVSLSAATISSVTAGSGINTASTFPQRYRVTAGNRGETAASDATAVSVSKPRSEWSGATEYVDIVINRVTGAEKYHIYYGTEIGSETYLFSVDDPGTGTTVTWRDTGVVDPNTFRPAPAGDTTAGPIGTRAAFINGQLFIVGDKTNPKYVRFGGTGLSILDFSPYGGGGYEPVGGNKEYPVRVASFRANDGTPAITVLCKGTSGFGKRYIFTPQTVGGVATFAIHEENGNDGTEAPDSVILAKDQLWYLSRDGVKTTLTKPQVQTILSTDGVSDNIENDVRRLNTDTLGYAVGLEWENRLYWAVAAGADHNNQIWVLDLNNLRRGAWMLPWNVAADWLWLYNDNSGLTHFCYLQDNQILEFTDNVATQDNGVAFPTSLDIGIQKFSDDGKEWGDVSRVTFVLDSPQGTINVNVTGKTEDEPLAILGGDTFIAETDVAGWDEAAWDTMAWDEVATVPNTYGVERTEIIVDVDEELNWWSAELSTTTANCSYELSNIIIEYVNIGVKE